MRHLGRGGSGKRARGGTRGTGKDADGERAEGAGDKGRGGLAASALRLDIRQKNGLTSGLYEWVVE